MRKRQAALRYLAMGFVSGLTGYVLFCVHLVAIVVGLSLPAVVPQVRRLTNAERRRAGEFLGTRIDQAYRPVTGGLSQRIGVILADSATWRDLAWLGVNGCYSMVAMALSVGLTASALLAFVVPVEHAFFPEIVSGLQIDGIHMETPMGAWVAIPLGLLNGAIGWTISPWLARTEARLARWLLAPTPTALLARRVDELATSRAETVDSRAAELRHPR